MIVEGKCGDAWNCGVVFGRGTMQNDGAAVRLLCHINILAAAAAAAPPQFTGCMHMSHFVALG